MKRKIATCPYCPPQNEAVLSIDDRRFRLGHGTLSDRKRRCNHLVYADVSINEDRGETVELCTVLPCPRVYALPPLRGLEETHRALESLANQDAQLKTARFKTICKEDYFDSPLFLRIRVLFAADPDAFTGAIFAEWKNRPPLFA